MAGRTRRVELREVSGRWFRRPATIAILDVPDYAPREEDRAWVERELGDVEPLLGSSAAAELLWITMDGSTIGYSDRIEFWDPQYEPPPPDHYRAMNKAGDGMQWVPVESLGRDE